MTLDSFDTAILAALQRDGAMTNAALAEVVNLSSHGQRKDDDFARFVESHAQIRSAFSVSGDADYVLDVRVRDLDAFADFVHRSLLPHPQVSQVRSEIVLKTLKDDRGLPPA